MSAVATTPLTYNGYVTQICTMAVVNFQTTNGVVVGVDAATNAIIPQMLNYAELRIQRDLDLQQLLSSKSYSISANSNSLQISVNDFVTIETLSVTLTTGDPYPLTPVSKEYLQAVYGGPSNLGPPRCFTMIGGDASSSGNTYTNLIFGPYSDGNYAVTAYGKIRMPSLNLYATAANANTSTTFISTYYPDMLLQASMIYIAQYQRNFGQASNDPSMGPTFELQYQNLLKGALGEEYRRRFQASAWSSESTPAPATPTR